MELEVLVYSAVPNRVPNRPELPALFRRKEPVLEVGRPAEFTGAKNEGVECSTRRTLEGVYGLLCAIVAAPSEGEDVVSLGADSSGGAVERLHYVRGAVVEERRRRFRLEGGRSVYASHALLRPPYSSLVVGREDCRNSRVHYRSETS